MKNATSNAHFLPRGTAWVGAHGSERRAMEIEVGLSVVTDAKAGAVGVRVGCPDTLKCH